MGIYQQSSWELLRLIPSDVFPMGSGSGSETDWKTAHEGPFSERLRRTVRVMKR